MLLPQTNKKSGGGGGGELAVYQNLKQNEAQSACAESTNKGLKDVMQTQQQRPNLPTVVLTWHASKYISSTRGASYVMQE